MKFVSCGVCFAPVKIKETVVIEHKRVCMECRVRLSKTILKKIA